MTEFAAEPELAVLVLDREIVNERIDTGGERALEFKFLHNRS